MNKGKKTGNSEKMDNSENNDEMCKCEGKCECQCDGGEGSYQEGSCGCCCEDKMPTPEEMFYMYGEIADEAWEELVREKMKKVWEQKIGKEVEETAQFFVKASLMKWMDFEGYKAKKEELMSEFMKNMEKKRMDKK